MWNWEREEWPNFRYDQKALAPFEAKFLTQSGHALGVCTHISEDEKNGLKIELMSEEALKTSKIEGEDLDRNSLQSSIRREFGLQADGRKIPPAEQGVASMMVDLYHTFDVPMSHEKIGMWHEMLMNGRRDLKRIGVYRTHQEPMQVVSGSLYEPTVHFEAPPSSRMTLEMTHFITWFNQSSPNSSHELQALTRAGIAHLYFVCIHPFEDGNGRIGRAIAEQSLAQNLGYPTLISLAYTIERSRHAYYAALERNNRSLEITDWLIYFSQTVLEAQVHTQLRMEFIVKKARLYDRLRGRLNVRQEKVLERLFREGVDGFKGGLSAENYHAITGAPSSTVTRDLQDLVEKQALARTGQLKYTRYYLNLPN